MSCELFEQYLIARKYIWSFLGEAYTVNPTRNSIVRWELQEVLYLSGYADHTRIRNWGNDHLIRRMVAILNGRLLSVDKIPLLLDVTPEAGPVRKYLIWRLDVGA